MIKIIHVGDLHLGGAYPEKAAASIEFLLGEIGDFQSPAFLPDVVVCTGDTTERGLHVHSDHLKPLLSLIRGLQCPCLFLQGTPSHEPYGFLRNVEDASGMLISVLDEPRVDISPINGWANGDKGKTEKIAIASLPALTRFKLNEWVEKMLGAPLTTPEENVEYLIGWIADQWKDFRGPKILLGHWTISGCTTSTGQTLYGSDVAVSLEQLKGCGANAVLVGHIHKSQEWRLGDMLVSYCGSSHPVNWGELDEKSFSVIEFDEQTGAAISFTRVPYPHKPMVKIDLEFTGEQVGGEWIARVYNEQFPTEFIVKRFPDAEVKVCYSIPKEIAAHVDDMYIRVLFNNLGIEIAAVERTIRAGDRERIANIGQIETTCEQYVAVCTAKGDTPREGALAKADEIDQEVRA